jgi:hypothetical protein
MKKKIVMASLFMGMLILLTAFSPVLASKNNNLRTLTNDLVTIEVNRYLGRKPDPTCIRVTSAEAEQIKQDLTALYDAQQRNDRNAITKYEALLNEKGIFGNSYQKFYANDNRMTLLEKTRYLQSPLGDMGSNISNSMCYFNAIGEGIMLWWLGLQVWNGIVHAIQNVSNPLAALILLIALLPLLVLTLVITDLIPFRILAPYGSIALQNGTISSTGTEGHKKVDVGATPCDVNLSGFTGITINIPSSNNNKPFLFVSGFALSVEG